MQQPQIQLLTLAQLSAGQEWRLSLAHDRDHHLLIWITRGQGRLLLDGQRRGLGTYNALWIPARSLFAMELGFQCVGHAVVIPENTGLCLPDSPRQLRIREVQAQSELSALIELAQREVHQGRPLQQDALKAQAALMSVWLRRQIMLDDHITQRPNAAARLSARFCALLAQRHPKGGSMADHAAELGVTPTHLTRAVKSATGKSAADLLHERSCHAARRLLGETDQTAAAIAAYLGFGSAAYFTRFMQQHSGLPPSKLR